MHALQDLVISFLAAGAVVVVLAGAYLTSVESSLDTTGYYAAHATGRTLVETFERDLPNIGADVPTGTAVFVTPWSATASPRTLEFRGRPAGSTAVQRVRYVVTAVAAAQCGQAAVTCFQVGRASYAEGATAPTPLVIGRVTALSVQFDTVSPEVATAVAVAATFPAPPAMNRRDGKARPVENLTWARRFRLPNLALRALP